MYQSKQKVTLSIPISNQPLFSLDPIKRYPGCISRALECSNACGMLFILTVDINTHIHTYVYIHTYTYIICIVLLQQSYLASYTNLCEILFLIIWTGGKKPPEIVLSVGLTVSCCLIFLVLGINQCTNMDTQDCCAVVNLRIKQMIDQARRRLV